MLNLSCQQAINNCHAKYQYYTSQVLRLHGRAVIEKIKQGELVQAHIIIFITSDSLQVGDYICNEEK